MRPDNRRVEYRGTTGSTTTNAVQSGRRDAGVPAGEPVTGRCYRPVI